MKKWLCEDPPNVAVITTNQVLQGNPILYLSHDEEDGCWQFHTGEIVKENDAKIVSLQRIVKLDSSVEYLANLPLGWIAIRKNIVDSWYKFKDKYR